MVYDNSQAILAAPTRLAFPHYKPEELEVAKRFLKSGSLKGHWVIWLALDTPQSESLKRLKANPREIWHWQLQIDATCETDTELWIVEFKERLRPSGVGQLLVYKYWHEKTFKPSKPVRLIMVATIDDPAVREFCETIPIRCELV